MEHVVDNSTACGLQEVRPHPVDHPPRAPELGDGAAGMVLTTAPDVGQPPVVDNEVVWRGDRRSIRDTGLGSMDRSTESRLATPEDFPSVNCNQGKHDGQWSQSYCYL